MIKTVDWEGEPQTIFDVALVTQQQLLRGVSERLGEKLDLFDVADLVLAEVVRRYVVEDTSPPGGQDQTRLFDGLEVLRSLGIEIGDTDSEFAVERLLQRDLIENSGGFFSLQEGFRLTPAGIERGLALLDKFAPRKRPDLGPDDGVRIDSSLWTGLKRKAISPANKKIVISAIDDALRLVERDDLTNAQRVQALSLLRAARLLADAPDPPSVVIWDLVERAGAICGILGIFIALMTVL